MPTFKALDLSVTLLCSLRDAAQPIYEADRHAKKERPSLFIARCLTSTRIAGALPHGKSNRQREIASRIM
jgi:hypothetical protein